MPPVSPRFWCRAVGPDLWMLYVCDEHSVTIANLTNRRPTPLVPDE